MASITQAKIDMVELVRQRFDEASAVVLVDFRGVTVEQVTDLRVRFREKGVDYRVVKNTLLRKAVEGRAFAEDELFKQNLAGPTAVAWSYEDPSAAAKIIKAFRKENEENEKLSVKCGLLDDQVLNAQRVEAELALLPGKDELRATLLAQLMAPAQNLVRQLGAPGQNLAYGLEARRAQLEEGGA